MSMDYVCVYCGSSDVSTSMYEEAVDELAAVCLDRDIGLVYGGASSGLMGRLADAILDGGGTVTGVIPETILERETPHEGLTKLEVTETKSARKTRMAELADGFVALPGGLGTQEELFTTLGRAKHGMHGKPCGCVNVGGYYDSLGAFLDNAVDAGFISDEQRSLLLFESHPEPLLKRFEVYESPISG